MCHAYLNDPNFYFLLYLIDRDLAEKVQKAGCAWCGGVLHSARYPRKPRGIEQLLRSLDHYDYRFSFCCAREGCRRRCTPPSVRFLGRKVYLGLFTVLVNALPHKLNRKPQSGLIESLDIPAKTLSRWRAWWHTTFSASRCWRIISHQFLPPIGPPELPDELLARMVGNSLQERLCKLLQLVSPVTTTSYRAI